MHKTTRAGATTSLIVESMNREETFLSLVPTNKIADNTIIKDAKAFCDRENTEIVHIPSNHKCIYNQEQCKEFPTLRELPILPIAEKCEECKHYGRCEVTAIFRKPNADGYVLTYSKIAALLMANVRPNSTAHKILEIINKSRNIILDEVHEMQYGKRKDIVVYDSELKRRLRLDRFKDLSMEFPYIGKVIEKMGIIDQDEKVNIAIHEVFGGAEGKDYWKKKLNLNVINPCFKYGSIEEKAKMTVGVFSEIIELTKRLEQYKLNITDVLELYSMLSIVTSEVISVNAIKDHGIIKVNLTSIDYNLQNMINAFVMSMQSEDRRIILTSATICSYDYSKLFLGHVKPINLTFGSGGDPLNTNSKMTILADHKKYNSIGENSRFKKKDEIVSRIIEIMEAYEGQEISIVTIGIKEAEKIERLLEVAGKPHEVTYYKSSDMMGVSSSARIMIAVGVANKPSNAFDAISTDVKSSRRLLEESIHCDTWQAWSRVKDPNGKEPSLVFALGCCVEDCRNVVKWGFNRTLEIEETRNGQKKKVNVICKNGMITEPTIIKCKTFDGMLEEGSLRQLPKQLRSKHSKPSIQYISYIDGFSVFKRTCLDSSVKLLNLIINRTDAYAQQQKDGTYRLVEMPITETTIREHINGNITIGTYHLNKENKVRSICFDIDSHAPKKGVIETDEDIKKRDNAAEERKDILCNFLSQNGIHYLLEASGTLHSYHFWILLKPVDAEKAHDFGHSIRRALKWKEADVEIFPKQKKIDKKGYGNLIKLPFATHQKHGGRSKILVNGEFVREFDSLEVGILDLSSFVPPVTENAAKKRKVGNHSPVIRVDGKVQCRPRNCILEATKKQLPHYGGNQLRVAIVRELYVCGMPEKDIIEIFSAQEDFDRGITTYHVHKVLEKDLPPVSCLTLHEQCGDLLGCDTCTA